MASYGGGSYGAARSMVSGPANGLVGVGALGILLQVGVLVSNVMLLGGGGGSTKEGAIFKIMASVQGTFMVVLAIIGIVVGVVIIMGAQKMRALQSYGFAMTSAILAMTPFLNVGCLLGLPIGIWAVLVIARPAVSSSFMT